MREVLFRGKTVNEGEWIESMTISYGIIKRKHRDVFMEVGPNKWKGVERETVSQYTGLKDKNEKKIFEGDILETKQGIAYVIWDDAAFALKSPGSNAIDYEHSSVYESSDIIGNIYDNSEMLEFCQ